MHSKFDIRFREGGNEIGLAQLVKEVLKALNKSFFFFSSIPSVYVSLCAVCERTYLRGVSGHHFRANGRCPD